MDKIAVKFWTSGSAFLIAVHKPPQLFPGLLGHRCIGLPLVIGQIHRRTVVGKGLLGLLPGLSHLLLPLHLFFCLLTHGLLGNEKALKYPVKGGLLFPGFGIDRTQCRFHLLLVFKSQNSQDAAGIRRFLWANGKAFQPQHPGKSRDFLQVDFRLTHGDGLRSDRRSYTRGHLPGLIPLPR